MFFLTREIHPWVRSMTWRPGPLAAGALLLTLWLTRCSDEEKRAVGDPCANATDCMDNICLHDTCGSATPLVKGQPCSMDAQCRSFRCSSRVCAPGQRAPGDT